MSLINWCQWHLGHTGTLETPVLQLQALTIFRHLGCYCSDVSLSCLLQNLFPVYSFQGTFCLATANFPFQVFGYSYGIVLCVLLLAIVSLMSDMNFLVCSNPYLLPTHSQSLLSANVVFNLWVSYMILTILVVFNIQICFLLIISCLILLLTSSHKSKDFTRYLKRAILFNTCTSHSALIFFTIK